MAAEYSICLIFTVLFSIVIYVLIAWGENPQQGQLTAIAFVLGALTSIGSGYIGMKVAVFTNVRTTINAQTAGYVDAFASAFRGGGVVGFALSGLGIFVLYTTLLVYKGFYKQKDWSIVMDCIAGFGLGGSSIALFGRVGGGIYTKAADVGADLVGKVVHGKILLKLIGIKLNDIIILIIYL